VEAIAAAYPTPQALWGAYQGAMRDAHAAKRCATSAARALLADLPLPSGGQRVGQGRSAKVYDLLFASQG
jgi:hypothetical protein